MQKLYRININHFEDPLKNERLLDLVGIRRREKVIRYRMPDDRKVWVQGSSSEKSSMKTGLRKAAWDILTMKSRLWMAFFNVSHAGTMLWVCCQTAKSGAILRKMPMRLLRWQNIISTIQSLLTSRLRRTKIRRFYALDIKRKLYENDRQRNEPSFGFFWSGSHSRGFVLGKSSERPCFLRQWNLTVIFSRSAVRGLFLFTIHWKLLLTIFMYDHRWFFRHALEFQSDRKAYMSDIASAVRENWGRHRSR